MEFPLYDINNPAYNPVNPDSAPVKVYELGYFVQVVEHFLHPHRHSFYMLTWCTGGKACHSIDFHQHDLKANRLSFMTPEQVHCWLSEENPTGFALFFDPEFFYLRYQENALRQFQLFRNPESSWVDLSGDVAREVTRLFESMLQEFNQKPANWDKVLRSYINILLHLAERNYAPAPPANTPPDPHRELVNAFEDRVLQKFTQQKQVQAYAEELNVSPNHLNAVCKKKTGQTASEIIQKQILLEAKRLLYHTGDTVSEVAYQLGYDDPGYFSRFFRKHTRQTPEQFRREQIQRIQKPKQ